jgi:DNA-binding transcriptional LysR family regulator
MNWDDLRIIAAVKDEGTYAGAGARLRIDETTVSRRLARLERALGMTLFEAVDGARRPTQDCERIAAHIQAMSRHVAEIAAVKGDAAGPVGRFRIAATNAIAEEVLAPRVARFLAAHPGLALQLLTSNDNVNFSRWEADLAIRLRKPDRGDFSILKLAEIRLYLLEPAGRKRQSGEPVVCCYPSDLDLTPESQFLASRGLQKAARCVTDNVRIIRSLIETREAVGVLPDYMCDGLLADARFRSSLLPRRREAWLLVQSHLKGNAAARVVVDWIRSAFADFARR